LSVSIFAYDNREDRTNLVAGQYAWRNRYAQVVARWNPDAKTEVLAQAMTGETAMGVRTEGLDPAAVGLVAAYVLGSRSLQRGTGLLRLDQFSVADRSFKASANNAEHGWSGTGA
jgi:hypothetical protein